MSMKRKLQDATKCHYIATTHYSKWKASTETINIMIYSLPSKSEENLNLPSWLENGWPFFKSGKKSWPSWFDKWWRFFMSGKKSGGRAGKKVGRAGKKVRLNHFFSRSYPEGREKKCYFLLRSSIGRSETMLEKEKKGIFCSNCFNNRMIHLFS